MKIFNFQLQSHPLQKQYTKNVFFVYEFKLPVSTHQTPHTTREGQCGWEPAQRVQRCTTVNSPWRKSWIPKRRINVFDNEARQPNSSKTKSII